MSNKKTTIDKTKDRILLIAAALSFFIIGLPAYFVVDKAYSEQWAKFAVMSFGYIGLLFYLPRTSKKLRKIPQLRLLSFQLVVALFSIGIVFLSFKCGILPMPESTTIYALGMIPLSALSMLFLEYCNRKWTFLKPKNTRADGGC